MSMLHQPTAPERLRCAAVLIGLSFFGVGAAVAQGVTSSQITDVMLYPGSATIQRVAQVSVGARVLQLACLPASFDVESLQLDSSAGIRVGDVSTRTLPRNRAPGCNETALDKRIAELEDQVAALDAEQGGNDLALGYLKGLGQGSAQATPPIRAAVGNPSIADTAQTIGATAQSTLLKQHQLTRRKEALAAKLAPLIADRDRLQRPDAQVRMVTIAVNASAAGQLRMRYQINGPTWAPSYRAGLDTTSGMLKIERLAQVAQASGEDWRGVHLRLSTGQPRAATNGPTPSPWRVGIAPPPEPKMLARSAPAMSAMKVAAPDDSQGDADVPMDITVFQGAYATEFEVPGSVDLISGEQRLTLSLGSEQFKSVVRVRATPASDAHAYLIAEIDRPSGVWPAGPLQLSRDGAFVGGSRWTPADDEHVSLSFGRDDLVQVRVEPEKSMNGSAGFIGGKQERSIARAYAVTNLHTTPIALEVLEATPVSTDETVVVTQRLTPPPTTTSWQKLPGVAQWQLTLAAGQSARFTADYSVTAPKDARLGGWR